MTCRCGIENCACIQPGGCILAGIIVGMLLLILLSSCGAINLPHPHRHDHLINTRQDDTALQLMRGDATPPVIKGDPFILALKNSGRNISPY